jgi:eukaryotic-like serine/threonine-protein kinase
VSDRDATDATDPDVQADDGTAATKREGHGAPSGRSRPASAADEDRLERGTLVGRYVVTGVLGAGGMGVVYSAQDPELDRKVAIKLLQARRGGSESGGQTWLLREAQAMARLAHPNVVAVYDVGEMPGDRVFVAMEFVEGMTLREWLRIKRSWREIVTVMRAAGAGLAAAHAAGLVHRDFKPDNVLVGNDGRVRVMDFGLARLHDANEPSARTSDLQIEAKSPLSERLTVTGTLLGTPAYMAPEIYGGEPADARADQFAFGVALYEALYRTRPFDRRDLVARRAIAPRPPAAAKVPAWIERVVTRAIALDPKKRFATMDALLAELAKDPTAGRRRVAIGAAVVLACGAAVAATFVMRGGEPANELCTGASAKLAGTWDATKKAALEAAFHKVHKPFVDDAIRGTEQTLDAYAKGWVDMRTEACQATRVHGTQSETVLTLRMACLDNRLVELKTLVGLFGAADEPLVLGAVTSAQKLSTLADCADIPALLAPDPLPKDPVARRQATELQGKLAEARALRKASKMKEAHAITTAIAGEVEKLAHKPTEAELHLLAGETTWVLEGADKGEKELMKAVWAAEAGKADETKVEAWLALTNLATEQSHFDVATERLQQASAALTRLGTNWDLKVRVLASQALLASRQDKYDDAITAAKEARTLAEHHTEHPTYAYALLVEATIENASGHPKDALDAFRKVLAYQDKLGHRRAEVAATLQTMAIAELQIGLVDDGIAHTNSALEIDEAIYGPHSAEVARAVSALGAAQATKGDLAGALATDQRALELTALAVGKDDEAYAQNLGQLAGTLISLKRPREAIPYLDRALAIQTAKLGPTHVQTLVIVLTKCDALHAAGKLAEAIATCEDALARGEKALGKTSPILFLFLAHLGEVQLDAKHAREAAAVLDRALQLGASDASDLYYVAMLEARARWNTGEKKRAVELARKARDGFVSLGDDHKDQAHDADAWLKTHHAP